MVDPVFIVLAVIVAVSFTPVMESVESTVAVPSSEVRVIKAVAVSPAARLLKPSSPPRSVMLRSADSPVLAPSSLGVLDESRE